MNAAITIRRGDRLYGPYSPDQIREMLDTGSLVLDDEAWSESGGQWTTLSHILVVAPNPSGNGETDMLESMLGNPAEGDSLPFAQEADSGMGDRVANILMAVGLIAIAVGTFIIVQQMDAIKARQTQGSTQRPTSHSP
ncbi:DUF4339 domain-containing protein [Luteolibacter sp. GHJ8]|uniref:DUF4339 domain-containing protein n=1 Tax=Luteolibacter rhizosphaerae TaxID=2989719 RepID=A0ABT3FZP4_9BACT|nr:DUF4339 domain-containing protein [Luteolibacter rhizosphaerae]MCW1913063.1 DUF4339 domain-containing protein [Luteolibacter rhizosphaerae]